MENNKIRISGVLPENQYPALLGTKDADAFAKKGLEFLKLVNTDEEIDPLEKLAQLDPDIANSIMVEKQLWKFGFTIKE